MLTCYTVLGDIDIVKDLDKDIKLFEVVEASNDVNSMCQCQMKFPWPMDNRELFIKSHIVADRTNKAIMYLTKSVNVGEKYFSSVVPDVAQKHVRMETNIEVTLL